MSVGAVTTYAPADHYEANVILVSLVFFAVNAPYIAIWTGFGIGLRRFLDRPAILRTFNISMAVLLSLTPVVFELLGR